MAMRTIMIVAVAALLGGAAPAPTIGSDLAGMRGFAARHGETLWRGYGSAPFGFLLVSRDHETLLCEDRVPAGFTAGARDPDTRCATATRGRSWVKETFLAAMPLFGPPSTIVMGTPESTGRGRGEWLRTILHEHFHQWQAALPGYWAKTAALNLSNGDETGMWMLNYPFPYHQAPVIAAHAAASKALADAVAARGTRRFAAALTHYGAARRAFQASVSPTDWRYAELQLWQEGVARWTEIALGKHYPDPLVRDAALMLKRETIAQLGTPGLAKDERIFAYAYGAGEAMVLDACGRAWRERYRDLLSLGPLLDAAISRCGTPARRGKR